VQVALSQLYMPLLTQAAHRWEPDASNNDARQDFFVTLTKSADTIGEAVGILNSGFMLRRPEKVRFPARGCSRWYFWPVGLICERRRLTQTCGA
jgi:hypothetical protein